MTGESTQTRLAIGDGLLSGLGEKMREAGLAGRAFLVADRQVAARFGMAALEALQRGGFQPALLAVEGGETAKTLERAAVLYSWLADERAERRDTVVALGGGVIGDLAGFVAATYLRGMPLVQVPTTVLAQVDSSIGGKTAVNLPQGKNLVGAFHPAHLTVIDIAFLGSLPKRELFAGWAEVVKTAIIFEERLFEEIEGVRPDEMSRGQLLDVIARCVRWKEKIVAEDPQEQGPRMILNFGHTIGHAVEAASGYGTYLHGEAVAIGMAGAVEISRRQGRIDRALQERIEACLRLNHLPLRYDARVASPERVLQAAASDKKALGRRLRWILTAGLGHAEITDDVPLDLVKSVLAELAEHAAGGNGTPHRAAAGSATPR